MEVNFFPWHVFTFILLQVQDTKVQGFVPGMKLESMDRTSLEADTYWVATVVMASGPLLLLRYDGYDDDRSGDFWCDAASDDLQPVGWCARNNHILIPPAGIWNNTLEMFIVHSVQWCLLQFWLMWASELTVAPVIDYSKLIWKQFLTKYKKKSFTVVAADWTN